jgi:hypothetical protein
LTEFHACLTAEWKTLGLTMFSRKVEGLGAFNKFAWLSICFETSSNGIFERHVSHPTASKKFRDSEIIFLRKWVRRKL